MNLSAENAEPHDTVFPELSAPPDESPLPAPPPYGLIAVLTLVTSTIATMTTAAGTVVTTMIAWRKDKREAENARLKAAEGPKIVRS
jgi:hypothetical protein